MNAQILRMIEMATRPLKNRIMMAIARGVLETVKDDQGIQRVKLSLLKDEVRENIERIQNFGFTSNPPEGSESVVVFVGGNREHGFVVACDHRASRKKNLQPGECAIYTDDGTYIVLKKGGEVEVKAATKLTVDVPNATFKGAVKIEGALTCDQSIAATGGISSSGSISATGDVSAGATSILGIKAAYNTHTHPVPFGPAVPPIP